MIRFFIWFYEVCLRMNEIRDGKNIQRTEYPDARDLERLDKEFKQRTTASFREHNKER